MCVVGGAGVFPKSNTCDRVDFVIAIVIVIEKNRSRLRPRLRVITRLWKNRVSGRRCVPYTVKLCIILSMSVMRDGTVKQKSGRPLYFAGTVNISAPRPAVWEMLVDPETAATLTPSVQNWTEIEPNRKFKVNSCVEMGGVNVTLPIEITWSDMIAPSRITICTHTVWQKKVIETCTQLILCDDEIKQGTMIEFTAETSPISRALAPLAHTLIGRNLRQFFVNLKTESETAPIMTTARTKRNLIPVDG